MKFYVTLAVASILCGSATAADLKSIIPKPCQCQVYRPQTVTGALYVSRGIEDHPNEGFCYLEVYFWNEQYCPEESRCIPDRITKSARRLELTVVDYRPQCKTSLFRPHINPYLDNSTMTFGPFRPGERIKHYVFNWFTGNTSAVLVEGIAFLRHGWDRYGHFLYGTVPAGTASGPISATAVAENARGRSQPLAFTILVAN